MPNAIQQFFKALLLAGVLVCSVVPAFAHDLPGKLTILMYVKPQDTRLQVLLRVPMEGLTEIQFPLRGQGYLDFERAAPALRDAANMYITDNMRFFANGQELERPQLEKTRVAHAGDKSFQEFDTALTHVNGPPQTNSEEIYWKQAYLDVLVTYANVPANAKLSLEGNLHRIGLETHTVLRFLPPNGAERAFNYIGDPGLIQLEPSWWYAFSRFVVLGFDHILEGIDHLLFLLCLVIPLRRLRPLIAVVTAFTVAHSITLIAAALGMAPGALWFPPLIETLIALSILYMAIENIVGVNTERRWMVAFGFGLIHGFGFSFLLTDSLQFAGRHLMASLLAFNVGVELGQIAVLLVAVPVLSLAFKRVIRERMGTIILSVLVAHTAWHWMLDRGSTLGSYDYRLPAFNAAFLAASLRWLSLSIFVGGAVWLLYEVFGKAARQRQDTAWPVGEKATAPQPKAAADSSVSR